LRISKTLFKDYNVEIIYNPRLKNSYIHINTDNTIKVKTPYRSKNFALTLLEDKAQWIERQIQKNSLREKIKINLEDEVLLFGEIYSIDSDEATLLREKLHRLRSPHEKKILQSYDMFYKELAKTYLTHELEKYAKIMNLSFSEVKFRKMKSRWGSCSSRGVITLNSELMKLKKEFICYVIIHELAHLVHMNHSKAFHALVEKYLPNSKTIRKELRLSRVLE
jgi:hypothetical protein